MLCIIYNRRPESNEDKGTNHSLKLEIPTKKNEHTFPVLLSRKQIQILPSPPLLFHCRLWDRTRITLSHSHTHLLCPLFDCSCHSFTNPPAHYFIPVPLFHSLNHPLTHLFIHSLANQLAHSLSHSLTHTLSSLTPSLPDLLNPSPICHLLTHSLTHSNLTLSHLASQNPTGWCGFK